MHPGTLAPCLLGHIRKGTKKVRAGCRCGVEYEEPQRPRKSASRSATLIDRPTQGEKNKNTTYLPSPMQDGLKTPGNAKHIHKQDAGRVKWKLLDEVLVLHHVIGPNIRTEV